MDTEKAKIWAKNEFTEEELKVKADHLSNKILEKQEKEEALKSIKSSIKAEIDSIDAQITKLSNDIRNKYEYKYFSCKKERDIKRKVNIYTDINTGEIIKEISFTIEELQMNFAD